MIAASPEDDGGFGPHIHSNMYLEQRLMSFEVAMVSALQSLQHPLLNDEERTHEAYNILFNALVADPSSLENATMPKPDMGDSEE